MSDVTPSLNFYRNWLHDVGGIEQEAGEALTGRIEELEADLASAQAVIEQVRTEMNDYKSRNPDALHESTQRILARLALRYIDTLLAQSRCS